MEKRLGTDARNGDAHRRRSVGSAGRARLVAVIGVAGAALLAAGLGILSRRARRAELEVEKLQAEVAALRDTLRAQRAWSGAVQPLILSAPDGAPPPRLRLRPDQPYLPIVAAHDLMGGQHDPASRWMELRLVRAAGGEEVWRQPERLSQLWDPATRFVSLLVPCAPLRRPGTYRLLIHEAGAPEPRFAASFEIVPAGAPDP